MSQPLVTVCLPTIGRAVMLEETLESLDRQTYPRLEILLLDNACAAEGRRILEGFAERDPRARVLRSERRLPMFENFNRGVLAATGDYVVFFFDDDVYLPRFIEAELGMLLTHPTAGFVGSNYYRIDKTGRAIDRRRLVRQTAVVSGRDYIHGLVRRGRNVIGTPGIMYRRDLIAAGPFDESLSIHFGDFVMLMRLAEVADVALIATPLLKIRIHDEAASASLPPSETVPLRTRMLRDYVESYARRWPAEGAFVASLERGLGRSHRVGLLLGWVAAADDAEAERCLAGLRGLPGGGRLAAGLRAFNRLGFSSRRRRLLAPLLARLGRAIPV